MIDRPRFVEVYPSNEGPPHAGICIFVLNMKTLGNLERTGGEGRSTSSSFSRQGSSRPVSEKRGQRTSYFCFILCDRKMLHFPFVLSRYQSSGGDQRSTSRPRSVEVAGNGRPHHDCPAKVRRSPYEKRGTTTRRIFAFLF